MPNPEYLQSLRAVDAAGIESRVKFTAATSLLDAMLPVNFGKFKKVELEGRGDKQKVAVYDVWEFMAGKKPQSHFVRLIPPRSQDTRIKFALWHKNTQGDVRVEFEKLDILQVGSMLSSVFSTHQAVRKDGTPFSNMLISIMPDDNTIRVGFPPEMNTKHGSLGILDVVGLEFRPRIDDTTHGEVSFVVLDKAQFGGLPANRGRGFHYRSGRQIL